MTLLRLRSPAFLVAGFALLALAPAFADDPPPPASLDRFDIRRDQLYDCGLGYGLVKVIVSPDGGRAALVAESRKQYVWIEGVGKVGTYQHVIDVAFSPDGRRYAWLAYDDGNVLAFVDGRRIGKYAYVMDEEIRFSPDGKRYGYIVAENDKGFFGDRGGVATGFYAVIDGVAGEPFGFLPRDGQSAALTFSPDGARVVHFAGRGDRCWAVIDGEPGPCFDELPLDPVFTADGSLCAYVGVRDGEHYVMVEDRMYGPYPEVPDLVASPMGRDLAFSVRGPNSTGYMMLNGRPQGAYAVVRGPRFDPAEGRLAYWASDLVTEKSFVVCDSLRSEPAYSTSSPWFGDDGSLFYDVITDVSGTRRTFHVDGREIARGAGSFEHRFIDASRAGGRTACGWTGEDDRMHVVVDGVEYDGQSFCPAVWFSPDGGRFAFFSVSPEGQSVVVDGERQAVFERIGKIPIFSPDGRDVAYVARDDRKKWRIVVNGAVGEPLDGYLNSGFGFRPDGSLACYVVDLPDKLLRFTLRPRP